MRMKKSFGLTVLVCLAVVAVAFISCGGGGGGGKSYKGGIYKIEITQETTPAFGGRTDFGGPAAYGARYVGEYNKYLGVAYGLVDPNDPRNQVIADLTLAPTNADGMIEYSTKFIILTPADPAWGGKVLFDMPNRGGSTFTAMNQSGGSYPTLGDTAANAVAANSSTIPSTAATYPGFIFNMGYTYLSVAWDGSVPGYNNSAASSIGADLPIAYNPDGSSITGPSYEWLTGSGRCLTAYYNTANTDTGFAKLTGRPNQIATPTIIPPTDLVWEGSGGNQNQICLKTGLGNFQNNWIYELVFTAKDPVVWGLGYAATRDAVEFLRYATADSEGTPNPVAGRLKQIVVFTNSQPGRGMNDFIWLGFNEDSKRRKVFDGTMNYIGGGDGLGINYRFAQVGRTERARQNHIGQLEGVFPLSYTTTTDPFTGKTDGRNVRCTATNTCPKVMNIYSANEMWVKAASLATTDPGTGFDVVEPANVRNYQIAGQQHGSGSSPSGGVSATATNLFANTTVDALPVYRALWVAMDKWISEGTLPPASKAPSIDQGTATFVPTDNGAINVLGIGMVPLADLGMSLPADLFPVPSESVVVTVRPHWNYGPRFDQGILDIMPGIAMGFYKISVSKVDDTGNEIGGIRLPEVEAPIVSNFGWYLRAPGYGAEPAATFTGTDGSDGTGGSIPLALFDTDKLTGDSRKSLEELYAPGGSDVDIKAAWLAKRIATAQALYDQGFLLEKDRDNYETSGKLAYPVGQNFKLPSMYYYTLPASP